MLYACVRIFDVTGTVENFLGTKQGLRASPRALVSWMSFLKKKQKTSSNRSSIYLVFYPRFLSKGTVGHFCLALSTSHFFYFGEAVGFPPFLASYFVLHSSYIRILAIHRYKTSWRDSHIFLHSLDKGQVGL